MVEREVLGNKKFRYSFKKSVVELSQEAPRVVVARYQGRAHAEFVAPLARDLDALVDRKSLTEIFMDMAESEKYDSEFRSRWIDWLQEYMPWVKAVHILQRSSLVAVGIQIAALAVGEMVRSYTKREEFEAAIRKAVARAGKASSP